MASPAPSSTAQIARARLGLDGEEGAGGLLTEIGPWYRNLRKPSRQPPDWLFGPAWTVIPGLHLVRRAGVGRRDDAGRTFLRLSLVALIVSLAPISSLASWLIVPYLLWVTFAAWLNLAVVRLNAPFHAKPAGDATLEPR